VFLLTLYGAKAKGRSRRQTRTFRGVEPAYDKACGEVPPALTGSVGREMTNLRS